MAPIFPNSPYNKYYHFYNNSHRNSKYFNPEEYFLSTNDINANTNFDYVMENTLDTSINKEDNLTYEENIQKNRSSGFNFNFLNFENIFANSSDEPIFEFMGIKLYLDDLLILGLLFILYTEGVEDEMLFLSLILLIIG